MKIIRDETGFPLIEVEDVGYFQLWPTTKIQFERFIAESNTLGDMWYDSVLKLNPRISYRYFDKNNYERIFISGITSEETLGFAHWLGAGYDLPTADERGKLYQMLGEENIPASVPDISDCAKLIWQRLRAFKGTVRKFTLMEEGLVEWVREGGGYTGQGRPRSSFHFNTWRPLEICKDYPGRQFYKGFRLIRRY
jgi:hypothetical protein